MKKIISLLIITIALLFSASLYAAKVALIYDSGGKFDKSFNESAYNAAEKFKEGENADGDKIIVEGGKVVFFFIGNVVWTISYKNFSRTIKNIRW